MILLITPSLQGQECAAAIEMMAKEKVQLAATLKRAFALLRQGEFSIVVVDESLLDLNPGEGELLTRRMGTALPVYVNLGVSGTERVVRQVKAALRRQQEEHAAALRAAEALLRSELRSELTAILLSSEMALAEPSLPPPAEQKIKSVHAVAERMRLRLDMR
jgi:signal transduction histidine kinase